jgi:hypothetical protein
MSSEIIQSVAYDNIMMNFPPFFMSIFSPKKASGGGGEVVK